MFVATTARMTEGKMANTGTDMDMAFIECNFSNWKDSSGKKGAFPAITRVRSCHKRAVGLIFTHECHKNNKIASIRIL